MIGSGVLELVRGGQHPEPGLTLTAIFNMTGTAVPLPQPGAGEAILFRSEDERHGGPAAPTEPGRVRPFECVVIRPARWSPV